MFMYLSRGTRMCAALLAGLLLALAASPAQAGAAWRHWSYDAVKKCVSYGILDSEDIDPDEEITRGEFCSWVNRAFNLTVATGGRVFQQGTHYPDPYATDMLIASATGYLVDSGGTKGPNDGISREQAFTSLAAVYMLEGDAKAKTAYKDDADISSWARGPVNAMLNAGFISIGDKLEPQAPLTKGQAAQTLANMYGEIRDGDNASETYKNLTVRVPGVTVKNATVTGDLFVTSGVGDGDATFEDVTVYGRALIAGGGPNSVYFRNSTLITVNINSGSKTRVKLENTDLNTLIFTTSGTFAYNGRVIAFDADTLKLMFTGTFDSITKNADGSVTVVIDGKSFTIQFELPGGVSLDNISVLTPPSFGMVYSPTPSSGRNRTTPSTPSPTPRPGQTGFTITYENTLESGNPPVDSNTYDLGETATLMNGSSMTPPPQREKNDDLELFPSPEFVGWNTAEDYSGLFYYADDTLTITGDTTLYAVWSGTGKMGGLLGFSLYAADLPEYADYPYVVHDPDSLKILEIGFDGYYDQPENVIFANDVRLDTDFFGIDGNGTIRPLYLVPGDFPGTINGNGHTVTFEDVEMTSNDAGLFYEIHPNVTVTGLNVNGSISVDPDYDYPTLIGGIAAYNAGNIQNCNVSASITVIDNEYLSCAGGIVGLNLGLVEGCYTGGNVSANSSASQSLAVAGGIAGGNGLAVLDPSASPEPGDISNCSSTAQVAANANTIPGIAVAGGIIGFNTTGGTYDELHRNANVSADGTPPYVFEGDIVGFDFAAPLHLASPLNTEITNLLLVERPVDADILSGTTSVVDPTAPGTEQTTDPEPVVKTPTVDGTEPVDPAA